MAITDIFSKRQKRLRGEIPEVYVYDEFPDILKMQIIHIWNDVSQMYRYYSPNHSIYEKVVRVLCREYGLSTLSASYAGSYSKELESFFCVETEVAKCLDAVELFFKLANPRAYDNRYDNAIKELNGRFKEHGVGYQYENGEIFRTDSQLIHAEVVRPALQLLNDKNYIGVQDEFLTAHEHYRNGNAKEALNECLKSFESVMKSICEKRNWYYEERATASDLINVCLENNLIPRYWQTHYSALRSLLESSVPTGRNRLSSHGQGPDITSVPGHLVAYMLHMTASAIVFLVEAEKNL